MRIRFHDGICSHIKPNWFDRQGTGESTSNNSSELRIAVIAGKSSHKGELFRLLKKQTIKEDLNL